MLQYIPVDIFRASFKFFMGDTLRKKKEGGKRDKTFFCALYCGHTFYKLSSKTILKIVGFPFKNEALHHEWS